MKLGKWGKTRTLEPNITSDCYYTIYITQIIKCRYRPDYLTVHILVPIVSLPNTSMATSIITSTSPSVLSSTFLSITRTLPQQSSTHQTSPQGPFQTPQRVRRHLLIQVLVHQLFHHQLIIPILNHQSPVISPVI